MLHLYLLHPLTIHIHWPSTYAAPLHTHTLSQLSESDRTGAVIHNALEKHGLYSNTSYSLSQLLDGNSEQDIVAQLGNSLALLQQLYL